MAFGGSNRDHSTSPECVVLRARGARHRLPPRPARRARTADTHPARTMRNCGGWCRRTDRRASVSGWLATGSTISKVKRVRVTHFLPPRVGPHHRVEDGQELPHTRDEGDLLGFAQGQEPPAEGANHRIGGGPRPAHPYRAQPGTGARPPQMTRLPRSVPLSRARGATPTSAAICLRVSCPSSGRVRQERPAHDGPDPRCAAEQVF